MAVDKKISQLASGAPAQAGDEYVVARSGANFKLTLTNIAASMPPIGATTPNTGSFTSLTNSGNLTFSSTGQRITGDFSGVNSARVYFQTSTTNGATALSAMPNGTGTQTGLYLYAESDLTNNSFTAIRALSGTDMRLQSGITGTGTYLPMTFYTGGSERMRLDTSGNLGIGVTPSANTTSKLFNVGDFTRVGASGGYLFNLYYSITNARWEYAGTGTGAGWVDSGSGNYTFQSTGSTSGTAGAAATALAERMRIDSSGNVGIGGTAVGNARCQILGTMPVLGGNTNSQSFFQNASVPSSITGTARGFSSTATTDASSFTLTKFVGFQANQGTIGSGSTVTTQVGFEAASTLTGATNNYGFYSDIASGSNRWNFYAAGTANNYFAGNVNIGTTTDVARLHVSRSDNDVSARVANSLSTGLASDMFQVIALNHAAGTGFYFHRCYSSSATVQFAVRGDGTIYAQNTTVQSLSDARVKENVRTATEGLAVIDALRPVRFDFKEGFGNNRKNQLGFVAQEVEAVFPDAVDVMGDKDENGDSYKSVGPAALIPVLVKAIQELSAKVAALEAK